MKHFRLQRNLKLKDLSKATGPPVATISGYEHKTTPLPVDFLQRAAKVLGVTAEQIEKNPEQLRETSPEFRAGMDLGFLTDAMLNELFTNGIEEVKSAERERRTKVLQHLVLLSTEMDRREI